MALGFSSLYLWQNALGIILLIHCQLVIQADDASKAILEEELIYKGDVSYFKGKPYTGSIVKFHNNNKKAETYSLKNGKLHGVWVEWNIEGQIINQAKYRNGLLNGVFIQFRSDGSREFEVTYVDGVENGPFKRWFKNGRLWVEENYFAGKLDGPSKIFYSDGRIQVQSIYQSGKKNGLENAWYDNGKLRWEIFYEEGKIKNKLRWKSDGTPSEKKLPTIF